MLLMALDHTRDYFHADVFRFDPEDLSHTTPALFLTRWITHYCAPVFVMLAGISAFLTGTGKKTKSELAFYLFTRGCWLVLLEITVVRFAWRFYIDYSQIGALVIWALGWSMIFLAGLIFFPRWILFLTGMLIVAGHNITDAIVFPAGTIQDLLWSFLHQKKFVPLSNNFGINVLYPVLPLTGLMMLGYCLGSWYVRSYDSGRRRRNLLLSGALLLLLFIILRLFNLYGDPAPWSIQHSPWYSLFSFMKTTKYPMSFLYLLMTIGPALLFLGFFERVNGLWLQPVIIVGRVPLFYYIVHLFVIHGLAKLTSVMMFPEQLSNIMSGKWNLIVQGHGFSLGTVYLIWICIILILYPLCRKYYEYKQSHPSKWLSYL